MRPVSSQMERQAGMTTIEIMVSMAIMLGMFTMAWSSFSGGLAIKRDSEAINERFHEIRIAMGRMVEDLSSAYISANEDQSLEERRTFFIGKDSGKVDELRFTSMGHRVLWADANESEQTMLAYFEESDQEDSSKKNLIRRENRRPPDEDWENEPAEIEVLLRDVKSVQIEYYDWPEKSWREGWDSTAIDGQRGRLPSRVRITVELENEQGDEVKFVTQARLMLQEELKFFTN
ncbi:MAG: hypothetical protein GY811_17300 [Myxococcales bacterium]|nr:hypothetical protein [Myxococcales bacterium]